MRNFQDTFKTIKRSFMSAFLISMTVPLRLSFLNPRKGRSSYSQVFFKVGVLKNYTNVTGKHLPGSLIFIKLKT